MSEAQISDIQQPSCPVCARTMQLKQVLRRRPFDHYVFKCAACELEYPVVKKSDNDDGLLDAAARHR